MNDPGPKALAGLVLIMLKVACLGVRAAEGRIRVGNGEVGGEKGGWGWSAQRLYRIKPLLTGDSPCSYS